MFLSPKDRSTYGVTTTGDLGKKDLSVLGGDRLIGTTPGTPKAIKDKLEKALLASINDPEFVAWGKKAKRLISPLNAADTTKLVGDLYKYYYQYKDVLAASNKTTR